VTVPISMSFDLLVMFVVLFEFSSHDPLWTSLCAAPLTSISGESAICYGDYVTTARVDCYCLL
jgi:hypothetical protein